MEPHSQKDDLLLKCSWFIPDQWSSKKQFKVVLCLMILWH